MKTTLHIAAVVSLNWLISRKSHDRAKRRGLSRQCSDVVDWKFDRRFGRVSRPSTTDISRRFVERSLKNAVTCSIQVSFYSSGSARCNTRSGINADLISIASRRKISDCRLAQTLKFAWLFIMRSACFDKIWNSERTRWLSIRLICRTA